MAIFTGTSGDDSILGTGGDDQFHLEQGGFDNAKGGHGDDVFYLGASYLHDTIDGGAGTDRLVLDGDYSSGVEFGFREVVRVEVLELAAGHSYQLTGFAFWDSSHLTVDASALAADDALTMDARGRTDPLHAIGGAGDDRIWAGLGDDTVDGGAGADVIRGGAGGDLIRGGGGGDLLIGGDGDDVFETLGEATIAGGAGADLFRFGKTLADIPALIRDLESADRIDLKALDADTIRDGNQHFHLVGALSGHAGELALVYDAGRDVTRLEGDVDGDGQADFVTRLAGDHTGFTNFVL